MRGDACMSLEPRQSILETACRPAAEATVTTVAEVSSANDVFARMPPPPPIFVTRPLAGPLSFLSALLDSSASSHARCPICFRTTHQTTPERRQGAYRRTSHVWHIPYESPSPRRTITTRWSVLRPQRQPLLTRAVPRDGNLARASHNTHQEEKR